MVKTLCFHCRGHRFSCWLGKILHAVCVCVCVCESRSVMSDSSCPLECSPPDSSVHGIFHARILGCHFMFSIREAYLCLNLGVQVFRGISRKKHKTIPAGLTTVPPEPQRNAGIHHILFCTTYLTKTDIVW